MLVEDIMTQTVHVISPDHSLADLQTIFDKVTYRHLLVEENHKLVGLISDRDMLQRLSPWLGTDEETEHDRSVLQQKVGSFMSTDLITVDRLTLVDCATILLLENKISCLPVVDENNAIEGIVSWKDLLKYSVYGVAKEQVCRPRA